MNNNKMLENYSNTWR